MSLRCFNARLPILAIYSCISLSCSWASPAYAAEATIAVAANFTGPMQLIAPAFEKFTGHKLTIAYGTVGKFYAQIRNSAPFDVLVSSDQTTPANLEKDGLAV